jgi:hypothetical protein
MTENLPELVPHCEKHGPMTLRPAAVQTKEQLWCGAWYDCTSVEFGQRCGVSALTESKALRAQLDEKRAARAARVAAGTNMRTALIGA